MAQQGELGDAHDEPDTGVPPCLFCRREVPCECSAATCMCTCGRCLGTGGGTIATVMKVYVVTVEQHYANNFRVAAVCSSMEEVVRRFGTTWHERVDVYEATVDGELDWVDPKAG